VPASQRETLVAPARRLVSVLHVAGQGNRTVCGLDVTDPGELWAEVELRDGERVCLGCRGRVPDAEGLF
jgi:hypothetical protein